MMERAFVTGGRGWVMRTLLRCLALTSALAPAALPARACTLWAAVGADAGGGTLLSKNRDWRPDHRQTLRLRRPSKGYAYLGLYAEDGDEPGIKAGINAQGLSIVSASVNIPKALRASQPGKHGVIARILAEYGSVDALGADAAKVFSGARAAFFMISDRTRVMVVEVGLEGRFNARVVTAGTTAHTNHFLDPELAAVYNGKIGQSSATRLARISELLGGGKRPFTLEAFEAFSRDRHDGPDDSLWRNGQECTLASWIVDAPAAGAPKLHVVIANPGEPETVRDILLDGPFWKGVVSDSTVIP